jgi:hypothetical protein
MRVTMMLRHQSSESLASLSSGPPIITPFTLHSSSLH